MAPEPGQWDEAPWVRLARVFNHRGRDREGDWVE
jgi:hypothetical protein